MPIPLPTGGHGWAGGLKGGLTNFLQSAHSRKPTRLCRGHGGCGRCKVRPRPPWVRLSRMGRPLGGQTGMAASWQGYRHGRWRRCLHPCLLTAMGGRGDSREGLLTSCNQPIPNCQSCYASIYIYKSKFVILQIKICIFASNKNYIT